MSTRREKSKPQLNKQLEATVEQTPKVNLRKEKLANYLIDVSKYGLAAVISTLCLGLSLTSKRKDK